MRQITALLSIPFVLTACAADQVSSGAANIAGKWEVRLTFDSKDSVALYLDLTQNGSVVTGKAFGTGTSPDGTRLIATDESVVSGTVQGQLVKLNVPVQQNGTLITYKFDGALINGTIDGVWNNSASVAGNFRISPIPQ